VSDALLLLPEWCCCLPSPLGPWVAPPVRSLRHELGENLWLDEDFITSAGLRYSRETAIMALERRSCIGGRVTHARLFGSNCSTEFSIELEYLSPL